MSSPVEKIREGNVSASIFQNEGPKGAFRTATIQLRYKDKKSGEWKDGESYGGTDLANLAKVVEEARKHIHVPGKKAKTAQPA